MNHATKQDLTCYSEPVQFVARQLLLLSACSAKPTWALHDFDHRRRTRNEEEQALCGPLKDQMKGDEESWETLNLQVYLYPGRVMKPLKHDGSWMVSVQNSRKLNRILHPLNCSFTFFVLYFRHVLLRSRGDEQKSSHLWHDLAIYFFYS